jgi:hypothetical protein
MEWLMEHLQSMGRMTGAKKSFEAKGLAGWLLGRLFGWQSERLAQRRQLHLIETLPLGGKRQLMLVACGGEHFLVGGGLESVETIVRVRADEGGVAPDRDEICL